MAGDGEATPRRRASWRQRDLSTIKQAAAGFYLATLLACGLFFAQWRSTTLETAQDLMTNLARVGAWQVAEMLRLSDTVLCNIRIAAKSIGKVEGAREHLLGDMIAWDVAFKEISGFTLHDQSGMVALSSLPEINARAGSLSLADRSYARFQAEHYAEDRLFISEPLLDRIFGDWVVIASRSVVDGQGAYRGGATARIRPEMLESILTSLLPGGGSYSAYLHGRGLIYAGAPAGGGLVGRPGREAPLDLTRLEGAAGRVRPAPGDGATMLAAWHQVGEFPLSVVVTQPAVTVLAGWWQGVAAAAAVELMLGGLLLVGRGAVDSAEGQRHRAEAALRDSEKRFGDVAQVVGDFIWETDAEGRLTFLSDRAESTLGRPPAALLGHSAFSIGPEASSRRLRALFAATAAEHRDFREVELEMVLPDGRRVWQRISGLPVFDGTGALTGWRGASTDVTEAKAAAVEREALVRRLTHVNADLQRLTEITAHHLQEPVRRVVSYAQLIERTECGHADPHTVELLHHMMAGAHRMRALVRDLQVYLAAAETAAPLTLQRVRTMACLERVRRDLGEAIRHSAAQIEAGSLPVVSGDPVLLATLFRCLIDNALKHRPPEVAPRIILSARREDGQWVFSVKDNGSGIDPRYIPRLFRVFEQLRASDGEDATGIGLAMARIIVERHGGRIWVESAGEGHGSTFHFTLPEDAADMSGSPTAPAGQAG